MSITAGLAGSLTDPPCGLTACLYSLHRQTVHAQRVVHGRDNKQDVHRNSRSVGAADAPDSCLPATNKTKKRKRENGGK